MNTCDVMKWQYLNQYSVAETSKHMAHGRPGQNISQNKKRGEKKENLGHIKAHELTHRGRCVGRRIARRSLGSAT